MDTEQQKSDQEKVIEPVEIEEGHSDTLKKIKDVSKSVKPKVLQGNSQTDEKEDLIVKNDEPMRQLMKEAEPMWFTNLLVERPCLVLCVCFIVLFLLTFGAVKLDYFAMNTQGSRDFLIWNDPIVVATDKLSLAKEYLDKNDGSKVKAERI